MWGGLWCRQRAASRGQCERKEDEFAEGRCCPTDCVLTGRRRHRRSDRPRGTTVGKSRRDILEWTRTGPEGGTGLGQEAGPSVRWDASRAQAHVGREMWRAQGAGAASSQTAPESTVEPAAREGGARGCLRLKERQGGVAQLPAVFGGPWGAGHQSAQNGFLNKIKTGFALSTLLRFAPKLLSRGG